MLFRQYRLVDRKPVLCSSLEEAAEAFGSDRIVDVTHIDDIVISTVFLSIDHNHFREGPPVLFETMIFGGHFDQEIQRTSTWDEAQELHNRAVEQVRHWENVRERVGANADDRLPANLLRELFGRMRAAQTN